MQVFFRNGVHLPESQLWLDPHHPQPFAVVSHAHSDHVQRHDHVLATPATAAMMRLRGIMRPRFEVLPFGEAREVDDARVTLYPAGHILGSAQVLVERRGVRLLYSGDFKLRRGWSAEPIEVPRADIVVMETTFGKPRYRFPPSEQVLEEIKEFCRRALFDGCTPVLLCYSLGKGQELLAGLTNLECPIYLHSAHYDMARLYADFGVPLPPFRRFIPGHAIEGVLLCGSGCRRSEWFGQLPRVRTAYISGWAIDRGACWRFRTDAAFPLSDHADFDDLHEYVRLTGARRVCTLHGFAEEFAADLRRRGIDAQPLRDMPAEPLMEPPMPSLSRRVVRRPVHPDQLALFE